MVSADTGIEVIENNELVCPGHGRDGVFQVYVESVFHLVGVSHGGGLSADQSGKFLLGEWEADGHQAIVDPLGAGCQLFDQVGLDGKANSCLASLIVSTSNPKERSRQTALSGVLPLPDESR